MVVLRCTQQLLRRLHSAPATVAPESTTRLGDWYGTAFQVGSRRYGLFIAERTRLPIVLDAHAHLGNLAFDIGPESAVRHYEVGVRIGELSLGGGFDGVLPWGWIDNRPFLRCLHGYGLCLWRLERFGEAAQVFDRILWLNPSDNQGARFVIDAVRRKTAWTPDCG